MLMRASTQRPTRRAARGASLIEVLVAVLVASMGILAMSGLLANAARFSKTSEYRAIASLLAADIADRMRANMTAQATYKFESTSLETSAPDAAAACAVPALCTAAELALIDRAAWRRAIYNSLPQGTGYLTVSDAANRMVDIWIVWREPSALTGDGYDNAATTGRDGCPPDFDTSDGPRCMYFRVGL